MLDTVTAREIQRNYRRIFDQVKGSQRPIIVISNNQPQVAIVSLDVLARVEQLPPADSAQVLLEVAGAVRETLKDEPLPADLSEQHDKYVWKGLGND
jgi:hypothetical protein